MLAIRLDTDIERSMEVIQAEPGRLLDFCYRTIGCDCIEVVHPKRLPYPYVMIVDESGALKGLPVNPLGSVLYETDKHGWPIVGTAVLMKEAMTIEGPDIVFLDENDVKVLQNTIDRVVRKWGYAGDY